MSKWKVVPSYRFHKPRKCAVATIDGKNFYLGPFDSPECYEKYARLISEWKVEKASAKSASPASPNGKVSASVLLIRFATLEKYKLSSFGRYVRQCMSHTVESVRFAAYID